MIKSEADPGEGPGGLPPPPPHFPVLSLDQTEAQRAEKMYLYSSDLNVVAVTDYANAFLLV